MNDVIEILKQHLSLQRGATSISRLTNDQIIKEYLLDLKWRSDLFCDAELNLAFAIYPEREYVTWKIVDENVYWHYWIYSDDWNMYTMSGEKSGTLKLFPLNLSTNSMEQLLMAKLLETFSHEAPTH